MTNFIPILPIDTVIYPGETYRLHVAEEQHMQLVTDCYGDNKPFGIIPVINGQPSEMGTSVSITEVAEVWTDGRMNIVVKGYEVFKTLEILKNIPDKLYGGTIATYPDNSRQPNPTLTWKVTQLLKDFHHLVSFTPYFDKPETERGSYDFAHTAGLSLREEYELLELMQESQRLEYLRRHLVKTIPTLTHIQSMLRRAAQGNDFKNHPLYKL
ncbi:MAG: LON peptidase substrate-binding domain-containing protein [Chitinophagaceae bacterium]